MQFIRTAPWLLKVLPVEKLVIHLKWIRNLIYPQNRDLMQVSGKLSGSAASNNAYRKS